MKLPVFFIGHGSPMNAIENNEFTREWKRVASEIPKPQAILCISAHWLREGTAITAMSQPKTIHDFGGFPKELYEVHYKAKGNPILAKQIQKLIKTTNVSLDNEWGLDHGTWSVLNIMYPKADIPTLQLSLDYNLPLEKLFKIGQELQSLREQGILIIASGNIVHNLGMMNPNAKPYQWNIDFDNFVKSAILKNDYKALINYHKQKSSEMAQPTNDHYLPLLYVIGAAEKENIKFFNEKLTYASLSMRCIQFG